MKRIKLEPCDDRYRDYLMDASLLQGQADELVFCHSTEDVKKLIDECYAHKTPLTIQGALTGICGGGVPKGGCVLNVSEMTDVIGLSHNQKRDEYLLKVAPGLLLKDLNDMLVSKKFNTECWSSEDRVVYEHFKQARLKLFPPDPTETLASIGGLVACDASGACSYKYGSTRNYVESIKVVTLINGVSEEISIERGCYTYKDIKKLFNQDVILPKWHVHNKQLKDVAGLYYDDKMDLIDLFIGGEGLFGVITEISLLLKNAPNIKMGLMVFLDRSDKLVDFIEWLRGSGHTDLDIKPSAIEYFDKHTFKMLNGFREIKSEISELPRLSEAYEGGLYLEFHFEDEKRLDQTMIKLFDHLKTFNLNEIEQWLALEHSDYEKLKNFRHSVPECVNILVADQKKNEPNLRKVATDMAVPNEFLSAVLDMYQKDIEKENLKAVVFGHIGDNHLHVNMIPKTMAEYNHSLDLVNSWASQVIKFGGTVAGEHGIGKIKKDLLNQMMSDHDIKSMKIIKKIIEPSGLINQGTLLD